MFLNDELSVLRPASKNKAPTRCAPGCPAPDILRVAGGAPTLVTREQMLMFNRPSQL